MLLAAKEVWKEISFHTNPYGRRDEADTKKRLQKRMQLQLINDSLLASLTVGELSFLPTSSAISFSIKA